MPVRYRFILSLPERVVRSLGALSGGLLREIGVVALPASVRRTTLYRVIVEVTLRFLIEQVGHVEGVYPAEGRVAANFLLKRGASHGLELLGILTIHVSPIWVLAALADATGAGHTLVRRISEAWKEEGLLPVDAHFDTIEELLSGLEKTSSQLAGTLNMPPLDVAGLRREWNSFRQNLPAIPPENLPSLDRLERIWTHLLEAAAAQNRSVFMVCSAMTLSTVSHIPANLLWASRAGVVAARRTGEILGNALLLHYTQSLEEITRTGIAEYVRREFRPYLHAAAEQFAPGTASSTEHFLSRRSFRKRVRAKTGLE